MSSLRIVIGYDESEAVAYHVLSHSIMTRASAPVSITPLVRPSLPGFTRTRGPLESTDFSISRFLTPSLCDYKGWALYLDCDMVCLTDVHKLLWEVVRQPGKSVYVAKHDYTPSTDSKMLGQKQTAYPRKNWSSVILFDCAKCRALTTEYVNTASGLDLHRFTWLKDDEIGELPRSWNHLVGEYPPDPLANILHYTLGTPCWKQWANQPQADVWWAEFAKMKQGLETPVEGEELPCVCVP